MKNKLLLKRVLCMLLVLSVSQITFENTIIKLYARDKVMNQYCEAHPLEGYLYLQSEENTGKIKREIEQKLNKQGVFDEEIKDFSAKELEVLNNAEDISVSVQYIEYTNDALETIEEKNLMENAECQGRKMSKDDVDELIWEIYLKEELKKECSVVDKTLSNLGLKAIPVYAASQSAQDINKTSYLKKTLVVAQVDNTYVHITFYCNWLISPADRKVDLVSVQYFGGDVVKNQSERPISAKISYKKVKSKVSSDETLIPESSETISVDYSHAFLRSLTAADVAIPFQLPEIENYREDDGYGARYVIDYENIRTYISFYLDRGSLKDIEVNAEYQHQKKKFSIDASAVINATAFAVSFAATSGVAGVVNGVATIFTASQAVYAEDYYVNCGGDYCSVKFLYK